jgi:hypothetical protein
MLPYTILNIKWIDKKFGGIEPLSLLGHMLWHVPQISGKAEAFPHQYKLRLYL